MKIDIDTDAVPFDKDGMPDKFRIEKRLAKEPRRGDENPWHMKQEVVIGLIIALLTNVVTFTVYTVRNEGRMDLISADNVVLHKADTEMSASNQANYIALKDDLKELNKKIDRLIERGIAK
jgi:Tfp pilus assembly protein PilO